MSEQRIVRPDELPLYQEVPVPMEEPLETFGDVMKEIKRLSPGERDYSWQQLASFTGLKRSTLKSITTGELKPPRSVVFLESIKRIPGVTDAHIQRLITAADTPNWLAVVSSHFAGGDKAEHRVETVFDEGVNLLIGLRMDQTRYGQSDLDLLSAQIRRQVEGTISTFQVLRDSLSGNNSSANTNH